MHVHLLYFDGCPNWQRTAEDLDALAREMTFTLQLVEVGPDDDLPRLGFGGSPTVLIDGIDPFATPATAHEYACRVYQTSAGLAGSPTREQLRAALGG
jgi:hypothetical protein